MLIYIFVFLALFMVVFASMPGDYIATYFASSAGVDQDIADYYSLANVTMYNQAENFSLSYPEGQIDFDMGLPGGQRVQFLWGNDIWSKIIGVRHLTDEFFGIWYGWHRLKFDGLGDSLGILRPDLVTNWDDSINGSLFWADCNHIRVSMFVQPNGTYTDIGESYDNNELRFIISYEVDWNATQISAFNVLGKLLMFQSPDLRIPGTGGTIINMVVSAPIWSMIAILIIKIIQSVIPFIRGIEE